MDDDLPSAALRTILFMWRICAHQLRTQSNSDMKPEEDRTQKEDHDVLTHNMILPVGAMGIIGVVLITFLVFMAARWQDGIATDRSLRTAVTMLDQIHRDMARTTIDYGRFLRLESDRHWTLDGEWLDTRIGHPITTTHGYDWIIIINGDDGFDYVYHDGKRVDVDPAAVLTPAIRRLIGLAREPRAEPIRAHSGLGKFQGEVQFVGVTRLSESTPASPVLDGTVLLLATALDAPAMAGLSSTLDLPDLRIVAPEEAPPSHGIPLIAADGTALGGVTWTKESPGQHVFDKALFLIILASPALLGLAWAFVRRARDTVLIVMERERALHRERERAGRYLSIVGSIIVAIDADGRIELVNDRGCRVLGRRREDLIGCDWVAEFVVEEERERVAATMRALLQGERDEVEPTEYQVIARDGERRAVAWQSTTVLDDAGTVTGILSSGDDITDRLAMEDRNRQQEAELAHFFRLGTMGEMATNLAHELNQPLAAIKNYAQGCVRRLRVGGADTAELLEALDQVNKQATRAGEIIKRIRRFVGKQKPASEAIDVNEAILDVVEMMGSDLRRQRTTITLELADDLSPTLADLVQIEQVILNLVRNGLEALADAGHHDGRMVIKSERTDDDSIMVSVIDDGPGIDAKGLESLFDPFYTTKESGLGMGLSISRSIVEAHKGAMWVESVGSPSSGEASANSGTIFRFTLPIAADTTAA